MGLIEMLSDPHYTGGCTFNQTGTQRCVRTELRQHIKICLTSDPKTMQNR